MISRIYIEHFGHLQEKELRLQAGKNIIFGKNETGKSTIAAFIRCMLFGMDSGRKSDIRMTYRKRYVPQEYDFASGVLEIDDWVITRKFGKTPKTDLCTVTKSGILYAESENIGTIITGVDADTFENTWFVKQFDAYTHINYTIESRLSNLSATGVEDISFLSAIEYLDDIERKYKPIRNKTTGLYELNTKIADNLHALHDEEQKQKLYHDNLQTAAALDAEIAKTEQQISYYRAELDKEQQYVKYRQYCILLEECTNLEEQLIQTKSVIDAEEKRISIKRFRVYTLLSVVFAIIGILFLLAFLHPVFFLCLISFIPMTFCIAQAITMRKELRLKREQLLKKQYDMIKNTLTQKQELLHNYGRPQSCERPRESASEINIRLQQLQKHRILLSEQCSKLQYQIQQYDPAMIQQIQEKQEELSKTKQEMEFQLSCVQLTKEILTQVYQDFRHDFVVPLQEQASKILREMTNSYYTDIFLNADQHITVKNNNSYISASLLSNAALDCVYFALRLGIIELMCPAYFLLLDDVLMQYDDERAKTAMQALEVIAEKHQIIYFTCQSRLKNKSAIEI